MNLDKLKQRGFTLGKDTVNYAAKTIRSEKQMGDTINLIISVEENGNIYLEEEIYIEGELKLSASIIKLGEVNSTEQFLVVYDSLNAIQSTGEHKL